MLIMKLVRLTQGYEALVDDEDFERVSKHKWHVEIRGKRKYAIRTIHGKPRGNDKSQRMHRFILNLTNPMIVDHIDLNGLNNQKINLRVCTNSQNVANKQKPSNNTSGYKGVSWYYNKARKWGRWHAQINYGGKVRHIGYFIDKIDAAKAYDKKAIEVFGKFARINFYYQPKGIIPE